MLTLPPASFRPNGSECDPEFHRTRDLLKETRGPRRSTNSKSTLKRDFSAQCLSLKWQGIIVICFSLISLVFF